MSPRLQARRGFTLVEVIVAMMLLMVIMATTVQTFRKSSNLLGAQGGRLEAQQNARFAVTTLDRDLRVAGVGTVAGQPLLVEADTTAIVFNVDLISRTLGDVGAVYVDTNADSNSVSAMKSVNKLLLPGMSVFYPNSTYVQPSGTVSGAETIAYYLGKDTTSSYSNQYNLYRRVNATAPQIIARGIQYTAGDTVFQFFKEDTTGKLTAIPMSSLPLYHKATIHGAISDTGKFALVDSVTMVKLKLVAVYHDPKQPTSIVTRTIRSTLRILNAGLVNATTCGNPPLGVTVSYTTSTAGASTPFITLTWPASGDDGGGEKDVESYAIYRRPPGIPTFNQPVASVPAGSATYSWTDNNVASGDNWVYGVSAQDCTPSSSPIGATGTIVVP
ncbi:MAG TPA: prepilin-type N-terminal cleavage/methylation domain-containing protein [Gemmatimonadaceae bacterium]|nr:prepilin-type N-terminal cleavage/methylation domain-containing protein [Gemmatimonadaceae bacterium]